MQGSDFFNFPVYDLIENNFQFKNELDIEEHDLCVIYYIDEFEDEDQSQLEKILGAINRTMKDCNTIEMEKETEFKIFEYFRNEKSRIILSFGVRPERLGLQLDYRLYFVQKLNHMTFVFIDNLPALLKSVENRKALWKVLKNLFNPK